MSSTTTTTSAIQLVSNINITTSKPKITKKTQSQQKIIINSCPKSSILEKLKKQNILLKQIESDSETYSQIDIDNKINNVDKINDAMEKKERKKRQVIPKEKKTLISKIIPNYDYEAEAIKDLEKQKTKINNVPNEIYENQIDRYINRKKVYISDKIDNKIKYSSQTIKDFNHEIVRFKNNDYVVYCVPYNDMYKIFI